MVFTQAWTDRGFSRNDILKLLRAECGCDHSDCQLIQMLDNINLNQDRPVLPSGVQRQGQKWDLDAVDTVIDDLRRQLPTGRADQLMSVKTPDEITVLPDEHGLTQIRQNLENPAPRTAFDPARGQYRVMYPSNPADVPAIATKYAPNAMPAIPTALAPTNPTIPAPNPFVPGQFGRPPINAPNPALFCTDFGGAQGTYYGQNPPSSGPRNGGNGIGGGGRSSGDGNGQRPYWW